jgi:hypothetical protein
MSENADHTVIRRKPTMARIVPSASPAPSSRRQGADHQRRGLRPGIAAARDDQRDEQREQHRFLDFVLEEAHRRRGQHFAEEQRRQPAGPLLDHLDEPDFHVGLVEGFRTADPLDVLGRLALGHVEHVVDGDDADEHTGRVGNRQRRAIVLAERGDGRLLIVGRLERGEMAVH